MPPPELPPLPPGPLSLAAARKLGLRDHQWRLASLVRQTQTVRALTDATTTRDRACAFALALPADCLFSHVSAAQLWGIPLPASLDDQVALDVMRATVKGRIERHGCISHRGAECRMTTMVHGLRVTSLADTWVDLGEVVDRGVGRDDLVVAGDVVAGRTPGIHARSPVTDAVQPMAAALSARVRPRHKTLLTTALALVRHGVRSPMETRARLMFHDAGFPEPQVNAPVHAHDGGWLAEGDLVWREQRVVAEYQGAVHAGIAARSHDAHRSGLLGDEGWTVLELFREDLFEPRRRTTTLLRFARALHLDPSTLVIT